MLETAQRRLDADPLAMRVRRETVEHPFGTLKARMGGISGMRLWMEPLMIKLFGFIPYRVMIIIGIAIIVLKLLSGFLSCRIDFVSARPISKPDDIIAVWANDLYDNITIYKYSDKYGVNSNNAGFGDIVDLIYRDEGLYELQFAKKESKCSVIIYTDKSDRLFFYRQFYWSFSEIAEQLTPITWPTTCEYLTRRPFRKYKTIR